MNPYLSICVPTYNRVKELELLFYSLKKFIKLKVLEISICDDGSTDDTQKYINNKINEGFNIKYKLIKHSGRPKALKESILLSTGEFIIICDSDDHFEYTVLNEVIQKIKFEFNKNLYDLAGFNYLCSNENSKLIGSLFPYNNFKSSLLDIKLVHNIKGDKCEVYKSAILKKNLYELIEGELRIPTMYLQAKLKNYNFLCFNKILKIKKYTRSGMSKNLYYYKLKSPNYTFITYKELYQLDYEKVNKFLYFKLSINYWRFYFHAANNYKQNKLKHNLFFNLPSLIIGFIIFVVDSLILRIKYENRDN